MEINTAHNYLRVDRPRPVARRMLPVRSDSLLICQREFGLVKAPNLVRTVGFNSCIVAAFFDPANKVGGIAHFDLGTNVAASFERIIVPAFGRLDIGMKTVKVRLFGGIFEECDDLRLQVRDQADKFEMKIAGLGSESKPGILLDASTGGFYDLSPQLPGNQADQRTLNRLEEAMLYLISGNPLLRNVSEI